MALQMKPNCEKCGNKLEAASVAFICSYECTYCPPCAKELNDTCPSCSGQLVTRPMRQPGADAKPPSATASATTPFNAYIDG